MESIRFGVIERHHVRTVANMENTRWVAIADRAVGHR
jgi:hypothetical protein